MTTPLLQAPMNMFSRACVVVHIIGISMPNPGTYGGTHVTHRAYGLASLYQLV